jgi:hypothetical protein
MAQFRLRTLFIATTVSGILFAAIFSPPHGLGLVGIHLTYMLLATACVAGIVYHREDWRAFFVGAAPLIVISSLVVVSKWMEWLANDWASLFMTDSSRPIDELVLNKVKLTVPLAISLACGGIAVAVRRWAVFVQRQAKA